MCELFGVSSPEKIYLNDLLKEFFSHGTEHPNGWGMAFFYGDAVSLEKQPEASFKSAYLRQRLRACIEADNMMAHIRLATRGNMDYENTHPFVARDSSGRSWTFEHNGTIFECDELNPYVKTQEGHTDSERVLLYIIDRINEAEREKRSPLSKSERFGVIDRVVCGITPENKLNFVMYDGELLYAHTNYKGSLYVSEKGKAAVISTRPLDLGRWEPLPLDTLVAYEHGQLTYTGTDHGNEFFDSEEKMRLLFLDFAGL